MLEFSHVVLSVGMILTPIYWTLLLVMRPEESKQKQFNRKGTRNGYSHRNEEGVERSFGEEANREGRSEEGCKGNHKQGRAA